MFNIIEMLFPVIFILIFKYMRMCYGSKTGYSTAVAMIMFLIVLIPVLISLRLTRTRD